VNERLGATDELTPLGAIERDGLFLVWGPPSHGPRSQVFARELGIDIEFVFSTDRRGFVSAPMKYLHQTVRTVGLLLRRRPRVVFVQSPPTVAAMIVAAYSALTGARYVVDAHSAAMLSPYWTRPRWIYRSLARFATATIVTNEFFAGIVRGNEGRALVIPDIPTSFRRDGPPDIGAVFNVVVVSTMSPDEPLVEVMTAAAELPDVIFHVTGDNRRARIRLPKNIPVNVRYTGFLPTDAYYALMADSHAVMCLTTRNHTMQRGACEALWMGRPIITSSWPVLQNYFSEGTVHVHNTAEAIRDGVETMVRGYPRYSAEIKNLQTKRRLEWRSALASLVQLLDLPSGVDFVAKTDHKEGLVRG
jgi:glycosyltransferase involved in cell wall biosynthesis